MGISPDPLQYFVLIQQKSIFLSLFNTRRALIARIVVGIEDSTFILFLVVGSRGLWRARDAGHAGTDCQWKIRRKTQERQRERKKDASDRSEEGSTCFKTLAAFQVLPHSRDNSVSAKGGIRPRIYRTSTLIWRALGISPWEAPQMPWTRWRAAQRRAKSVGKVGSRWRFNVITEIRVATPRIALGDLELCSHV